MPIVHPWRPSVRARRSRNNRSEGDVTQITDGHNVIEDYGHTDLPLRQHLIEFPRKDLQVKNIITGASAKA